MIEIHCSPGSRIRVRQAKEVEQAEILSATRGTDFEPYLTRVVKKVHDNRLMPTSVHPPTRKQGRVAIEFAIQSDGSIKNERIAVSSGDVALDQAAFAGINGFRFDPLPKDYPWPQLCMLFHYYNLAPDTSQALHLAFRCPSSCWFHIAVSCPDGWY